LVLVLALAQALVLVSALVLTSYYRHHMHLKQALKRVLLALKRITS
jgi:hypothetical protein